MIINTYATKLAAMPNREIARHSTAFFVEWYLVGKAFDLDFKLCSQIKPLLNFTIESLKTEPVEYAVTTNVSTFLATENDTIILSEIHSQEKISPEVKLSRKQLIQLLNDWRDKVCKTMPQYVMIKHVNDKYTIETSETPFD